MATTTTTPADLKFRIRKSEDRGHADHGWLKSFHTFSFASYQDSSFDHYGSLRVINEDRVSPTQGFLGHSHREFEIFSYVVGGKLTHKDSLNNVEVLKRGDLQMTSTGTGIKHSEWNDDKKEDVHFLQIWALPHTRGLKPAYSTRHFTDAQKTGKLVQMVGPIGSEGVSEEREAEGPAPVHSNLAMWATLLPPSSSVTHKILPSFSTKSTSPSKKIYLQVVQSSKYNPRASLTHSDAAKLKISGFDTVLGEGDGVFIDGGKAGDEVTLESVGGSTAEVVVFEMD